MSAFTFSTDVTSAGDIAQNAAETNGPGDDLTVNAGVTVSSTSGNIGLTAGDNVVIHGTVLASGRAVALMAGRGDVDNAGTITIDGTVSAATIGLSAPRGAIALAGSAALTSTLLDLTAGAGVSEAATVQIATTRLRSAGGITGNVSLTGAANSIASVGEIAVTGGDFTLYDTAAKVTISGPLAANNVTIVDTAAGGTLVHDATSATQTLDSSGVGSFTLSFNGQTTATLATTATATAVQAALNALPSIGGVGGNVAVNKTGTVFTITFGGTLAGQSLPLITATGSSANATAAAMPAGAISGQTVTLVADNMQLTSGSVTASDTIAIAPLTAGTALRLGDFAGDDGLVLSAAELESLSAPTLTFGKDAAGQVTAGSITLGTVEISASTVNLFSRGGVQIWSGLFEVGNGNGTLNVTAGGPVYLATQQDFPSIGAIGGSTTSGGFAVGASSRTMDHTVTVNDVSTAGGEIYLNNMTGDLAIHGTVASHGGTLTLATLGYTNHGISISGTVDAGSDAIILWAGSNGVHETGGRVVAADLQVAPQTNNTALDVVLDSATNAITGHVFLAAGSQGGNISFTNSTAYIIGGVTGGHAISQYVPQAIKTVTSGSVTLTAGGDITQALRSNDLVVTGTLNLARLPGANPNVTLGNAANQIARLGTVDLGSGALTLLDSVPLAVTGAVTAAGITLVANQMALEAGHITVSDSLALAPLTAGTDVALGDGVTDTFALSAAELATLSAPAVGIGRNAAGTVTAGTMSLGSFALDTQALNLSAQGGVALTTGTISIGSGSGTLTIAAGGPVALGGNAAFILNAASVGGSTTSGAFGVTTTSPNALHAAAITTQGGELTLRNAGGSVVIDGALVSHGGHIFAATRAANANTTINADIDAGSGTVVVAATAGTVTQTAGSIHGANLLSLSSMSRDLMIDSADNAITGRVALVGGNIHFTNTQDFTIGYASVLLNSIGGLFIAPPNGAAVNAAGTLALTTGGAIDQGHDLNDSLIAGTLTLARLGMADPNVTLDNTFNQVGTLGAIDLGHGTLTLADTLDLTLTGHVSAESLTLTAPSVTFAATAQLMMVIGGASPYGAVHVNGSVAINGATLDLSLLAGAQLDPGQHVTLIDNDGTDAVTGTFAGLAEGAALSLDGIVFTLSYHGGDGNDVTLEALANHAPVNTVPGAQSVLVDTDLAIAGLSVSDQDAGAGVLTTTLTVRHGTLTLAAGGIEMSGNGSDSVTLAGTLAQINAALAHVTYHGTAGFIGTDTLTLTTSDNGHTGLPGALTDTDSVKIDVTAPVQQAPQPIVGTDGDDSFTAAAGSQEYVGLRGTDTMVFGFALVDAKVSYVGNDIIIDGPNGSHTVMSGIETFVFTDGTVNNRDGSPLVDDLFYYANNHDVWTAHVDADTHYNMYGWREGRDPNAWFDTKGYLATYTDVAAAGLNPLAHYDQNGWREGRDPSTAFDTKQYLASYPDVAAWHGDPLAQFVSWGSEEGRHPYGDGVWG
jgi:hypothetical protein